MLADVLAGESPASGTCPVATVAISGGGKGDRPAESPEVKVPVGWEDPVRSARGANNSTGRSESANQEASKCVSRRKRMAGGMGVPSPWRLDEGQRRWRRNWVRAANGLPGALEDDMPRGNGQRKHGTTLWWPRSADTAKARRISRTAAKSRCAGEWGGWGRLSVDGPGQNNPDRSEGPWGRAAEAARMAVLERAGVSDTVRRALICCGGHEDGRKPMRRGCKTPRGKAPSDKPALEPYWGKPAVRNLRGDDGNVGIIRSPIRAIVLPDKAPRMIPLSLGGPGV